MMACCIGAMLIAAVQPAPLSLTAVAAASGQAARAGAEAESAASPFITEESFSISRQAVQQLTGRLAAEQASAAPPVKGGFARRLELSARKAFNGDAHAKEASRQLVQAHAVSRSQGGARTVVVVIGSSEDRVKVRESLSNVERQLTLVFVDESVDDARYDNSGFGSGLASKVTGQAQNVWVFLPRAGGPASRGPDYKLSSRMLPRTVWSALFAADGDVPPEVARLLEDAGRDRDAAPSSTGPAATRVAPGGDAAVPSRGAAASFAEGDMLQPKIPGVKMFDGPSDEAQVLFTLTRGDELVVTGAVREGYVLVTGSQGEGWVRTALVVKR